MKVFYGDHVEFPLPAGHRFPIAKYRLLRERLLADDVIRADDLHPAPEAPLPAILAVHQADYVTRFLAGTLAEAEIRRIGFPWSPQYARRALTSVGGTLAALDAALEDGVGGHLAGGTHHAFADRGAGYCTFNDLAVAARQALDSGAASRVLIFDVDVHQGDGTAAIFAAEPRVFTCSLHGARNFPRLKQVSDLDVALPDGTGDAAYLEALAAALEEALARSVPDLVLYQAGVDGLADDRLGRLALTHDGMRERDRHVFEVLRLRGLPVVIALGGGYGEPIDATVRAHAATFAEARRILA